MEKARRDYCVLFVTYKTKDNQFKMLLTVLCRVVDVVSFV